MAKDGSRMITCAQNVMTLNPQSLEYADSSNNSNHQGLKRYFRPTNAVTYRLMELACIAKRRAVELTQRTITLPAILRSLSATVTDTGYYQMLSHKRTSVTAKDAAGSR